VADYQIITQYPDVEVVGGSQTRDVQVIGVTTSPSDIYFEVRVPRAQATTSYLKYTAQSYRDIYELLAGLPGVADVVWYQRPTDAGQLVDYVTLYVTSTSGFSTGVIDKPFSQISNITENNETAALRTALDNTEAA